jgi:hypothetical protein
MLTNLAFFSAKPGQAKSLGKALTGLVDPGCICYNLNLFKLQKMGAHK